MEKEREEEYKELLIKKAVAIKKSQINKIKKLEKLQMPEESDVIEPIPVKTKTTKEAKPVPVIIEQPKTLFKFV